MELLTGIEIAGLLEEIAGFLEVGLTTEGLSEVELLEVAGLSEVPAMVVVGLLWTVAVEALGVMVIPN